MKKKKYSCLALSFTLLLTIGGCQKTSPKPGETGKTVITMMYPAVLSHFEELVETTYPDIDLRAEVTTSAMLNGDSERRLRNGHGTDLIVTTLPTGSVKEFMLDLSATAYATHYQATVMSPILLDGKTYYLPLPGQYSGYILNTTLAEQLADTIPASGQELLALLDAGREQGVGIGEDGSMFGVDSVDIAAIGTFLIGMQVPDFLGLIDGIQWMSNFQAGTATFSDDWDHCLDNLLQCVERGILNPQALSLKEVNALPIEARMLDGTLLLCYGNARLWTTLCEKSVDYEYTMMPFLSDQGNPPWTISSPDGYIGINAALAAPEKKTEYEACQRILELLSTQEGQSAWIADTQATNSYLTGYLDEENQVPAGLETCVENGYVYDLQMSSNIVQYFGSRMISVLNGKTEMADALAEIDQYRMEGSEAVDYDQSIVGSVAEDLLYENYNTRREETTIGNLVADAVAEYADAQIAVVNGGGIRASLYQGDVLGADLAAVCPYSNTIVLVEAEGRVIEAMLENGISQTIRDSEIPAGRFLQVSGLKYVYRPKIGDEPARLISVMLPDGTPLEANVRYKLAINNYMAGSSGYIDNNGDGYTMLNLFSDDVPLGEGIALLKDTGATYADAMRVYFNAHQDELIKPELENRILVDEGE